jgi:hypothetical protein
MRQDEVDVSFERIYAERKAFFAGIDFAHRVLCGREWLGLSGDVVRGLDDNDAFEHYRNFYGDSL